MTIMHTTRRRFVKTLFAAGQATLLGRFVDVNTFAQSVAPAAAALHFLVFGDWGVEGAPGQSAVAAQMARAAVDLKPAFMLAVGDNFYMTGVKSVDDPQWQSSFEKVYAAPSLQIPIYAILGNHDYCGNCDAQIEYGKSHPRWIMPARYYTQTQRIDDKTSAEFFFIDTCPFIGEYTRAPVLPPNPTDQQQTNFAIMSELHANAVSQDTEAQIAWLKAQLTASTADWKIVAGHHPIYSGGLHGDSPELIERVLPLLHEHGVHVYIAGHDHDLQHLQSDGIDFLCSGAGGAKLYPIKPNTRSKFGREIFGFMTMALNPTSLAVNLIDDTGMTLYATTIHRTA